jgi:hypothetical protein
LLNKELATQYAAQKTLESEKKELATQYAAQTGAMELLAVGRQADKGKIEKLSTDVSMYKKKLKQEREKSKEAEEEVDRLSEEKKWLIEHGFAHVVGYLRKSVEYVDPLSVVQKNMRVVGLHEGIVRGFEACSKGVKLEEVKGYNVDVKANFLKAVEKYEGVTFPYLTALASLSDRNV